MNPAEEMQSEIGEAIDATVRSREHGVVTRWIAVVETVGPDGFRGLWTMTSDELTAWETLGMLGYALAMQNNAIHTEEED